MYADTHRALPSAINIDRVGKEEQAREQLRKLIDAGLLGPKHRTTGGRKNVEFKNINHEISTRRLSPSRP